MKILEYTDDERAVRDNAYPLIATVRSPAMVFGRR